MLHGQYVIERFLNVGSFGMTYVARDSLERQVVLKECFPQGFCRRDDDGKVHSAQSIEFKTIVQLFMQEARALAQLVHPNIVGVHQVFEDNRTAYMALDHIDGQDLTQLVQRMFLPPDLTETILRALLDAIGFVHQKGLLHRDVSPDNILIDEANTPILIDFGAARQQAKSATRGLTALRVVKDGYSPPEFYHAGHGQGPWSDLYGLAATFYHLITGSPPPSADTRQWAFDTGHPDPYTPLEGTIEGYAPTFLAAIDRGLAMHPKDRFQTATEWLEAITPPPTGETGRPGILTGLRRPKGLAVMALGLSALTAAVFVWGLKTSPPVAPPPSSSQSPLSSQAPMSPILPISTGQAPNVSTQARLPDAQHAPASLSTPAGTSPLPDLKAPPARSAPILTVPSRADPAAQPSQTHSEQTTRLDNGLEIHVLRDGDGWSTTIAALPGSLETDLQVGDVIMAHVETNAWLSEPSSLQQMLAQDRAAGASISRFAVAREGRMAVAYLSLSNTTAPQTQP